MTNVAILKRKVERLEIQLTTKPEDIITVYMWTPSGKDPQYNGGAVRVKALAPEALAVKGEKLQNSEVSNDDSETVGSVQFLLGEDLL